MKLHAIVLVASHITQNGGKKTCTTSDLMKENERRGKKKEREKKTKTRQKHVEKNLFKCPAGPEQCQLIVRDTPGRSAEREGISLGSLSEVQSTAGLQLKVPPAPEEDAMRVNG